METCFCIRHLVPKLCVEQLGIDPLRFGDLALAWWGLFWMEPLMEGMKWVTAVLLWILIVAFSFVQLWAPVPFDS